MWRKLILGAVTASVMGLAVTLPAGAADDAT